MSKRSIHGASLAVGVFLGLALFFSSEAPACSCGRMTVEEKATEADAVFLGEVESVGLPFPSRHDGLSRMERYINFRVIEARKGLTGTRVGLITDAGAFSCGVSAVVGTQKLVSGGLFEGELSSSSCWTVGDPSQVEAELAELDRLGYEPLALTEGPDSRWPPYATGLCGLGFLPFLMMTTFGIACLRGATIRW